MSIVTPAFAICVVTLVVLLGHPALRNDLGDRDRGHVPELAMYTLWWVLGVLVAAYGVASQSRYASTFRGLMAPTHSAGIGHVYASVLLVLLLAHVGTAHWVFTCPFRAADLSPFCVGLGVLLFGIPGNAFVRRSSAVNLCVALMVAAVLLSVNAPRELTVDVGPFRLTPLMLAIVAAYFGLTFCFARQRFLNIRAAWYRGRSGCTC